MRNQNKTCYRGEIWRANLGDAVGSEYGGIRPVLILQNDTGNRFSPTTIVAAISGKSISKMNKDDMPVHHHLKKCKGLTIPSTIFLEQIRVIDKSRLISRLGTLSETHMKRIDKQIKVSLGID